MHATAKKHHAFNWIQQWHTGYILGISKTGMGLNYHCSWTSFYYLSINGSFWFSFIFTITRHPSFTTHSPLILTGMIFAPALSKYQVLSLASTVGCSHQNLTTKVYHPKLLWKTFQIIIAIGMPVTLPLPHLSFRMVVVSMLSQTVSRLIDKLTLTGLSPALR